MKIYEFIESQINEEITLEDTQDFHEEFGDLAYVEEEGVFEAEQQQELPVNMDKIRDAIQRLESRNYFTPGEADEMRRAIQDIATGRSTIFPKRLLQLLSSVA